MKSRTCNTCLILFCVVFYGIASGESGHQKVILVSVDTLRADFLGCYNPKMKTTPKLDQFAYQNVVFSNVTSQAPTTAPSHKSIFYSVYPSIHKTSLSQVVREAVKSPLEIIRSQGFKTAAFTGGGQLSRSFGFSRGFDSYWEPQTNLYVKDQLKEMEQLAFDWLEKNSDSKFFLFLHTYEVHCPYNPPRLYFQKWAGWYQGPVQKAGCVPNGFLQQSSSTAYEYIRSLYAAEVNYVDDFLGHLFEKLRSLGIYDQTLIVFVSDHGESLGEHRYFGHNRVYQEQLHVPLIFHIPNLPSAQIEAPVELLDIMPTLYELLGIRTQPYPFQGRSLAPLIRKQVNFEENRPLISEEIGRVRVRIGNLALIFAPDGTSHEELYDLKLDPFELHNIAEQNFKTVKDMKIPYFQMMQKNKTLSAQFVPDKANKPDLSDETREQLNALGYIAP